MKNLLYVLTIAATLYLVSTRPHYYYRNGEGGGGAPSLSTTYINSNGHGHDFGYDVQDPHYGNYQGRRESVHGNTVRGSYYLMEADGSLRRVDYVADHPGGFRATVSDKLGSRSFGYGDGYDNHGGNSHNAYH